MHSWQSLSKIINVLVSSIFLSQQLSYIHWIKMIRLVEILLDTKRLPKRWSSCTHWKESLQTEKVWWKIKSFLLFPPSVHLVWKFVSIKDWTFGIETITAMVRKTRHNEGRCNVELEHQLRLSNFFVCCFWWWKRWKVCQKESPN